MQIIDRIIFNSRMRLYFFTAVLAAFLSAGALIGQDTPETKGLKAINEDVLKAQISFLASDWTEGRLAGEKGSRIAGDYIAGMLQLYGVKPFGDLSKSARYNEPDKVGKKTYFQNFVLLKTMPGDNNVLQLIANDGKTTRTLNFTENVDFTVFAMDPAAEIKAPVVFAGYAYKNDELRYNDFAKLDVKGKFILKLAGYPGFISEKSENQEMYRISLKMDSLYRALGVAGIIEFSIDAKVAGRPAVPDFLDSSPAEVPARPGRPRAYYSIPGGKLNDSPKRISVSARIANELLKGTGIDLNEYIKKADNKQQYTLNQNVSKEIYLKTTVKTSQVAVRNILGLIEGRKKDEYIVLGAHYDHVGTGNGYIWNGADDNASGTAGVMTIAKAIMESGHQPEKSIIIALWDAEEEGLLGSRYFTDNSVCPLEQIKLNFNFDMISRYVSENETKKITMTYNDKYPSFRDITEANLSKYGIDLIVDYQPSNDPPGGSDHRSFVAKGITVMRFKPGHREEYHQPEDEFSTLDWDIFEKIVKISFLNTWQLANTEW